MRVFAVIVTAGLLAGCAGGGPMGPEKLPAGASAGIWTDLPTEQVAACLTQQGVSPAYQAHAVSSRNTVYKTVVALMTSEAQFHTDPRVFTCTTGSDAA